MTEAQITKAVMDYWRKAGMPNTLVAAIPNMGAMGQYGLTRGLPDLLVIRPNGFTGFIELKADKGKLSAHQQAFADLCGVCEQNYAVTYGRDEPIAVLKEWGVLR
jgi:hypothetical protein